ncbi:unnamed protein product [Parnassius apollo]|uniref:(apollo) hypothetical protein n=1 Tax=Parnassius apollo TaxID=110799 RepID=A0A8S3WQJ6_PARAO|nr:unnamed protein product [Parnassius apollo]
MEFLHKLQNLQLDSLSEEWVEAIFNSEFLEFGDLPPEFESALEAFEIHSVLIEIMLSLDSWLNEEPSISGEKSWAILSHQTHHQKLLCILAYFIDYGNKNVLIKEHRDNALLASRLYYKLLSIPGYKAYHIYHSQLFVHSLACLSFPKAMCDNEDNYFNARELTYEVNATIKELKYYVSDLKKVIQSLQLKVHDMNFEEILSNLVDITGGAIVVRLNIDRAELAKVSGCINEMIDLLICDSNGLPSPEAIQLVFKCLLPKLVAASIDSRNANNIVRASYVTYSGLLLGKYGRAALSSYIILLQHLCYTLDGLERAEIRTTRMSLVVGLMSLLPKKSYKDTIKWLLKLSTTAKVSHRQIALEILSKLLTNEPEELKSRDMPIEKQNGQESESPPSSGVHDTLTHDNVQESDVTEEDQTASNDNDSTEDENGQDLPIEIRNAEQELTEEEIANVLRKRAHTAPHAEIVRAVYERVNDASSALRMRALAILTECLESTHAPLQEAIKELNGTGEVSRLLVVAARCACDERAVVRRAAAVLVQRLLAAAPQTPPNDLAVPSHQLHAII